eukprot:gene2585-5057_t
MDQNINDSVIGEEVVIKERVRRTRKKKETKIVISLWVDGVSYEHGLVCTFCEKSDAIFHCSECKDFYCDPCDHTAHSHAKRSSHMRTRLSRLTKDQGACICTRAMRFLSHLKLLQRLARQKIRRIYCGKTFNHYYFNTVYGTTSWKKPYCLRGADLHPHLTPDEAAARIQGMQRGWKARTKAILELFHQYNKIFHRGDGHFYYAFVGSSRLISRQSWKKPLLLGCRGYPEDLQPVMTDDLYAMVIQRKWRAVLVWRFLRAIVRKSMRQDWDPVAAKNFYVNLNSYEVSYDKPWLLGREHWDPHYVPDWDIPEVVLFLRRLGLKRYVTAVLKYGIDGSTLLVLEPEDYLIIGVESTIHVKKIMLALEQIYPSKARDLIGVPYYIRREKIRKHGMFEAASTCIQRHYRGYLGRKHALYVRETVRLVVKSKVRTDMITAGSEWYTDQIRKLGSNANLPVKRKVFGRYREHLSVQGYGSFKEEGWVAATDTVSDDNPTRKMTERLARSGYDDRRLRLFVGTGSMVVSK